MAPTAIVSQASSQQLIGQAAQNLLDALREHGAAPSPFAVALLDLMDQSAKLQEFDDMMAKAQQEASSEEAKTWQQISLMSLSYCQKGLVEKQQAALQRVRELGEQGASLFEPTTSVVAAAEVPSTPEVAVSPDSIAEHPPPKPASMTKDKFENETKVEDEVPLVPPGVWVVGPPPGLPPPPGLESIIPASIPKEDADQIQKAAAKAAAPWRKVKKEKSLSPVLSPVPAPSQVAVNFDAYSSDSD